MRLALTKRRGAAIRILLHLASLPPGSRRTAAEISDASNVSPGNVPTLVAALSRAGLLDCTRGPGGGCALTHDPAAISIASVLEAVEGSLVPEHCAIDHRPCSEREFPCGIHQTWSTGVNSLTAQLGDLSLADALARDEANRRAAESKSGR